jgi:hypothetical protein
VNVRVVRTWPRESRPGRVGCTWGLKAVCWSNYVGPDAQAWAQPDAQVPFGWEVLVIFFLYRIPVHHGSFIELRP